jgi:hypothetical protein
MNLSTIEIHEFSTGIRPQQTVDGWVSLGFTGQYMNVTTERIPDVIERSIANREFAVAEGASSDQPAIIGRVLGTGENTFSVLAIVTRGRDEKGRSASMYRYFFTQGMEKDAFQNLRYLLAWWENQETPLRFNPFDIQEVGKPHICDINTLTFAQVTPREIDRNDHKPVLLPPTEQLNLHSINSLASKKYNNNKNGQPTSWAFNVEALEKPERFLVIQAASDKAYQILQKALSNTPKVLPPTVVTDEEAIKSAIRGLMNSSQVKPENVKVIADALANDKITSAYWHTLFDGQGAKTAIAQKIYSPQMVRLITLRAVVIPDTMLEFLSWLNIKPGQKTDDNQTVSLEFQKAINSYFSQKNLADAIKFLFTQLLKEPAPISPESLSWLLNTNNSIWQSCRHEFINDVLYDLQLIYEHQNNINITSNFSSQPLKFQVEIWKNLINYWRYIYKSNYKLKQYNSFALLFENLGENSLAGYFYQISEGVVPKDLFSKVAAKQGSRNRVIVFDLELKREVTCFERVFNFLLKECIVPIQLVIIISISLSILSFAGGVLFERRSISENNTRTASTTQNTDHASGRQNTGNDNNSSSVETEVKKTESTENSSSSHWKLKASKEPNFKNTRNAIDQIIKNISQEKSKQVNSKDMYTDIVQAIANILDIEKPNYSATIEPGGERMKWVEGIYKYQQKNFTGQNNWDGIITPGKQTATLLEEQLREDLGLVKNPPEIR